MFAFLIILFLNMNSNFSSASNYTMITFWGTPVSSSVCEEDTNITDFENCTMNCYNDINCMAAYKTDAIECGICGYYDSMTINKNTTGNKISLKINSDLQTCPTGDPPLFGKSEQWYNGTYKQWKMTGKITEDGDIVTLAYNESRKCSTNYRWFQRKNVEFCVVVYSKWLTDYTSAQNVCLSNGTYLCSLETDEDYDQIADILSNTGTSSIWIAGQRRAACNTTESANSTDCEGLKAFTITDENADGTEGYNHFNNTPDGLTTRGYPEDCLMMYGASETVTDGYSEFVIDDKYCDESRNFVCGYAYTDS